MSNDSELTEATSSQQEPEEGLPSGFLSILQIFNSILNWLSCLIQWTEEEQKDAGIYLGNQRDK
jgi:hypothetical protein